MEPDLKFRLLFPLGLVRAAGHKEGFSSRRHGLLLSFSSGKAVIAAGNSWLAGISPTRLAAAFRSWRVAEGQGLFIHLSSGATSARLCDVALGLWNKRGRD